MDVKDALQIRHCLEGQTILVTGATGFLGKVMVEKLLRSCPEVQHIYLLVRSKKEKDSQQRFIELFNEAVFARMRKERPDFQKKVTLVSGDVSQPDLGMSQQDKDRVLSEVSIVLHSAATVRFDEEIKKAVAINIFGTQEALRLCHSAPNLKAFVHISTAYANCQVKNIREKVYAPPIDGDEIMKLTECIPDEIMNICTDHIIKGWPNTYVFTKQIAEDVVRMYGSSLPTAIFRPAVVVGSLMEPVPGWIDNVFGVTGLIAGGGAGLIRTHHADTSLDSNIVPVDLTVNAIIATACELVKSGPQKEIPVYNYVSTTNPLKMSDLLEKYTHHGKSIPSVKSVYYYTSIVTSSQLYYHFLVFLLHLLPAIVIDGILIVTERKPQALKIYQRIYKFVALTSVFFNNKWEFQNDGIRNLWVKLSESDQKEFNFDINSVDWDNFAENNARGIRTYLLQDPLDTIPAGKKRMFFLHILHRLVQLCFFTFLVWLLWSPMVTLFKFFSAEEISTTAIQY